MVHQLCKTLACSLHTALANRDPIPPTSQGQPLIVIVICLFVYVFTWLDMPVRTVRMTRGIKLTFLVALAQGAEEL